MKILFFIDNLCAGGKERRLTELMKGLKLNPDINFELVVMNEQIHYQQVFNLNIEIHYLIRKTKKDLSILHKFYKICKKIEPDIVHCCDSMTPIIAIPTCQLLKIPLINGMVTDTPVRQNIFNKYWLRGRLTFPFSKKVIGNSNAGLDAYKAPSGKSLCIYNGIDFERFKNLEDKNRIKNELFGENQNNFLVVGMVAAFEARKDYSTVIRAALCMLESNEPVKFVFVGDGPDLNVIKNTIPYKFSDKILFLGKKSDIEVIVNIFDIGILMTNSAVHGEGISNSIIEYMALGKPVIATRGGGTAEAVIDGENGYLIDFQDDVSLRKGITELANDKILRERFGAKSCDIAHRVFDLKIMTDNYIKVYQKVQNENKN